MNDELDQFPALKAAVDRYVALKRTALEDRDQNWGPLYSQIRELAEAKKTAYAQMMTLVKFYGDKRLREGDSRRRYSTIRK